MSTLERAERVIGRWFAAALAAADPYLAVRAAMTVNGQTLQVANANLAVIGRIWIVAVGKAAVPMTDAAMDQLGDLVAGGIVITKDGHVDRELSPRVTIHEAAHPIPDERGTAATRLALSLLLRAEPDDIVLALISGGGSALLEAPRPPVTLADMAKTTDLLLRAGAPIQDLNAVRSPLSLVKKGGLRAAAPTCRFVTLVLSDVLGNDPNIIASGPTVPAERNPVRAREILERYRIDQLVPPSVLTALDQPAESSQSNLDDIFTVVGDNAAALAGVTAAINADGLRSRIVWSQTEGEAAELGRAWVQMLPTVDQDMDVVLGGGEATVTVNGSGVGGRNTEFALAAAMELDRQGNDDWFVASLATDGQDALTAAAGAIASRGTLELARLAGVSADDALRDNDSLRVFEAAGGVVAPGPTGTNVNDLYFGVRSTALTKFSD